MANTVFNAHKPARELPISRSTSKLLEEVDKQLKNLTTDVRHTYGREFIMLLLEMRRLIRKANAAQTLEEKAERIAEFIDAYDDLADLLKLKTDVGDFPKPAYIQLLIPLGSATTAVAAIRTGRNWIGYEMNTEFFTKEERRIKETLATPTIF